MQQQLNQKLAANPRLSNVKAKVSKGQVILSGGVQSNLDRQRAYRIASSMVGSKNVINHIVPLENPAIDNTSGGGGGTGSGGANAGAGTGPGTAIGNKGNTSSAKPVPH